ncbi:MAG TPA: flavodoxin [Candidatus Absconditabacterales bacterium]|nr:flavodoxin [Candidatus Absconditabacterales bacterium]
MKKILVVYYSRTGVTKKLALSIAQLLQADIEEIIDTKKRLGLLGYIMAGRDAALKKQTKIQKIIHDISTYDIVCIGTPVWDFTMSAAIRTYLTNYEHLLPDSLVFFCTQASSGAETAFQEMAKIVGKRPTTTMVYTSKEILKDKYMSAIQDQLASAGLLRE